MHKYILKILVIVITIICTSCVSNAITLPIKESSFLGIGCHADSVKTKRTCERNVSRGYMTGIPFDIGIAVGAGGSGGAVYGFLTIIMALFSGFGTSGMVSTPE